jgi:NAD(P)H-hydrate epimerase
LDAAVEVASMLKSYSAIGCGPGMTTTVGSLRLVERLLHQSDLPRVFDADAINCLAELDWPDLRGSRGDVDANVVLTPHPGELQRLTGVSPQDRVAQIDAAGRLAEQTGAVIVVKGGPTVVVRSGETRADSTWTNTTGNPGMATGGAGDVLTGVITSLLGQALSPWDAARLGVWIHGLAGDIAADQHGQAGMTAVEILDALPQALDSCSDSCSGSAG